MGYKYLRSKKFKNSRGWGAYWVYHRFLKHHIYHYPRSIQERDYTRKKRNIYISGYRSS